VLTVITKKNGPIAANRARATLSKFYRWAIGEGLCDNNPVTGTNKRDENDPRERSLSDAEAAAVWLAAPDNDYGRILKLILLTGCRRTELGDLKWSEIDTEARTITLPRERTKNGQEHVVPLTDAALAIVNSITRTVIMFLVEHATAAIPVGLNPRLNSTGSLSSKSLGPRMIYAALCERGSANCERGSANLPFSPMWPKRY
jgi:integrase